MASSTIEQEAALTASNFQFDWSGCSKPRGRVDDFAVGRRVEHDVVYRKHDEDYLRNAEGVPLPRSLAP